MTKFIKSYDRLDGLGKKEFRAKLLRILRQKQLYCRLCGELIEKPKDLSLDHFIPKSKGGANSTLNLVPSHKDCNGAKKDMMPYEWFRRMKDR